MTTTPDLVIRGGNIADGKGGDLYQADVAISGGRITEVGKVSSSAGATTPLKATERRSRSCNMKRGHTRTVTSITVV